MAFFIGITLAVAVGVFARWFGLDRDRAFYPTVMMVIAVLYVLFATMAGGPGVLLTEIVVSVGFIALAMLGFKKSPWFVVAALFAHGVFDCFHAHAIPGTGAPVWWPEFCATYDITAAALLGFLLRSKAIVRIPQERN
jgi:hypothetical protein